MCGRKLKVTANPSFFSQFLLIIHLHAYAKCPCSSNTSNALLILEVTLERCFRLHLELFSRNTIPGCTWLFYNCTQRRPAAEPHLRSHLSLFQNCSHTTFRSIWKKGRTAKWLATYYPAENLKQAWTGKGNLFIVSDYWHGTQEVRCPCTGPRVGECSMPSLHLTKASALEKNSYNLQSPLCNA